MIFDWVEYIKNKYILKEEQTFQNLEKKVFQIFKSLSTFELKEVSLKIEFILKTLIEVF